MFSHNEAHIYIKKINSAMFRNLSVMVIFSFTTLFVNGGILWKPEQSEPVSD
jgi:hypothetical protein